MSQKFYEYANMFMKTKRGNKKRCIVQVDPRLPRLAFSGIAPCLIMLITERHMASSIKPLFASSPSALADGLWRFAMAGLDDIKRDKPSE